jgi:hypothetical protein
MNPMTPSSLSQQELAQRWGRTTSAIGLASALGVGPKYIKLGGSLRYPMDEVQRYERACLFFEPAEVAMQPLS